MLRTNRTGQLSSQLEITSFQVFTFRGFIVLNTISHVTIPRGQQGKGHCPCSLEEW